MWIGLRFGEGRAYAGGDVDAAVAFEVVQPKWHALARVRHQGLIRQPALHVRRRPRAPLIVRRAEAVQVEDAAVAAEFCALGTYGMRVTGGCRIPIHGIAEIRESHVDGVTGPHVVDGSRSHVGPQIPLQSCLVDVSIDILAAVYIISVLISFAQHGCGILTIIHPYIADRSRRRRQGTPHRLEDPLLHFRQKIARHHLGMPRLWNLAIVLSTH